MKNAVIYLVNKGFNSLADEKREMITHSEKIPDVKITDIYIEEKPEDRKQLVTQLCEKIDKGEVQIILTNNFAFLFFIERENKLLADKINESNIRVFVRTNLTFDDSENLATIAAKENWL